MLFSILNILRDTTKFIFYERIIFHSPKMILSQYYFGAISVFYLRQNIRHSGLNDYYYARQLLPQTWPDSLIKTTLFYVHFDTIADVNINRFLSCF